jgi:hypothetical protein
MVVLTGSYPLEAIAPQFKLVAETNKNKRLEKPKNRGRQGKAQECKQGMTWEGGVCHTHQHMDEMVAQAT